MQLVQTVKACTLILSSLACTALARHVVADTFGSGADSFDIQFVDIGDPANPADHSGKPSTAGSVPYHYRIGKYEITRGMIENANAAGALGITLHDMSANGGNGADKPATGISWFEALRFVNWLNTSTGSVPAYKFNPLNDGNFELWLPSNPGYDAANRYRNSLATYFLPSVHEWYKAAYYNPSAGVYVDYPTGSDVAPTPVPSGTAAGTAVYKQRAYADVNNAGGLSVYGTMAQGGNAWELVETDDDQFNNSSTDWRQVRGGAWHHDYTFLLPQRPAIAMPSSEVGDIGFRVAAKASADFDLDGDIDGADLGVWRGAFGINNSADADKDGDSDGSDMLKWQQQVGNKYPAAGNVKEIPEPRTLVSMVLGVGVLGISAIKRSRIHPR